MAFSDILRSGADVDAQRKHLSEGDPAAITIRIPVNLRDAAKEEAAMSGMSFSAFIRDAMIQKLVKKD